MCVFYINGGHEHLRNVDIRAVEGVPAGQITIVERCFFVVVVVTENTPENNRGRFCVTCESTLYLVLKPCESIFNIVLSAIGSN